MVSNVLPFHIICEWGVKPLPSTISGTEFVSLGMLPGESERIWDWDTPWQLSNIPLHVQPDDSTTRTAMRPIKGKGLRE
jgi:hypothetical protein